VEPEATPILEDTNLKPTNPYRESKLLGADAWVDECLAQVSVCELQCCEGD
jgi:UDP-glucose 4-epimerase